MEWVSVASETVDQIGYDPAAAELHVRFRSGGRYYLYSNVPEGVHQEFLAAPSKGRFVHTRLKNGPYPCRRVA
jgi:hypothetical protein